MSTHACLPPGEYGQEREEPVDNDNRQHFEQNQQLESVVHSFGKGLSNLLAVLHGDGGHYEATHGTTKAIQDAIELIHTKWVYNEHLHDINKLVKEMEEYREKYTCNQHTVNNQQQTISDLRKENEELNRQKSEILQTVSSAQVKACEYSDVADAWQNLMAGLTLMLQIHTK